MKTYIKPYTYCTLLTEESHILAGSNPASTKPNQANSQGRPLSHPHHSR